MTADEQQKKRFEPPPWEQEAFERFERERAERQAQQELEAALRSVREPAETSRPVGATANEGMVAEDEGREAPGSTAAPAAVPAPDQEARETLAAPPDARIEAMLVELRLEEPAVAKANIGLINGVIGLFAVIGVVVIVQAALLFAGARTSEASGTMLAATMSFVVLLAGLGFVAGAVVLFRKYHR